MLLLRKIERIVAVSLGLVLNGCIIDHLIPGNPCETELCTDGGITVVDDPGTTSPGSTGAGANLIFVTPGKYELGGLGDGDGGVSVADAICNSAAHDLGHQGVFIALLSTSTRDLRDRIPSGIHGWVNESTTSLNRPVFDMPGSLQMAGRIGSVGYPVAGKDPTWVATGSTNWGTFAGANCENWTSTDAGSTWVAGDATELVTGWANASRFPCDERAPIYCAQVDHSATLSFAPPPGTLRVFITEDRYASGGGRAGFDQACASEAADAGLVGTFKAYVSTQSAGAPAGIGLRYRMDGAEMTDPEMIELFNPLFRHPIQLTATGRTLVSPQFDWPTSPQLVRTDTAVWFGDSSAACNDWFSTAGVVKAADATSLQGNHWNLGLLAPSGMRDCGQPAHLFCVEMP